MRSRNSILNEEHMFKPTNKGVEAIKIVENQPPVQEDFIGNNEQLFQQNE